MSILEISDSPPYIRKLDQNPSESSEDVVSVAKVLTDGPSPEKAQQTAQEIVRRYNAHEDFLWGIHTFIAAMEEGQSVDWDDLELAYERLTEATEKHGYTIDDHNSSK